MQNIDKSILRIALPSIVANITVPLLGLVDMAVSGHLGNAVYIGAVAVGSMIFNVIYWVFGFLRMGTSGMTSQALGRRDMGDVATTLARSIAVAIGVAAFILLLQRPLGTATLALVGATEEINAEAWHYFRICVWGMQNTRLPMFISIMQNVVNIAASCTFVYAFGMKVEGIALGTLTAQYAGLLVSLVLWSATYGKRILRHVEWRRIVEGTAMRRFFGVNRDIFLRTLCLVAVNFYFLSAGASQGAVVLAVNTLLMPLPARRSAASTTARATTRSSVARCAASSLGAQRSPPPTRSSTPWAARAFSLCSPTSLTSWLPPPTMLRGLC